MRFSNLKRMTKQSRWFKDYAPSLQKSYNIYRPKQKQMLCHDNPFTVALKLHLLLCLFKDGLPILICGYIIQTPHQITVTHTILDYLSQSPWCFSFIWKRGVPCSLKSKACSLRERPLKWNYELRAANYIIFEELTILPKM